MNCGIIVSAETELPGRFVFPRLPYRHSQSGIVGKAPFVNAWTNVLAFRLSNGSPICGGRFAMFEPKNEQGVVLVFQQLCESMGLEILSIQAGYPDALIFDKANQTKIRIEFEYESKNFIIHKHDPKGTDWIICWKKNKGKYPVPVLELSTLTTFPPKLYRYIPPEQPSEKTQRRPYTPRSRTVLVVNSVFVHKRVDDSEASILILDCLGTGGWGLEAKKDAEDPISKYIWQVAKIAIEAQAEGGIRDNITPKAKQVEDLAWKLLIHLNPELVIIRNGHRYLLPHMKKYQQEAIEKIQRIEG